MQGILRRLWVRTNDSDTQALVGLEISPGCSKECELNGNNGERYKPCGVLDRILLMCDIAPGFLFVHSCDLSPASCPSIRFSLLDKFSCFLVFGRVLSDVFRSDSTQGIG